MLSPDKRYRAGAACPSAKSHKSIALAALAMFCANLSYADTLLEYTFTGSTLAPTTLASGLVSQNLSSGAGLVGLLNTLGGNVFKDCPVIQANATSLAQAITNNDYLSLTVSPQSGQVVNLDAFTIKAFISVASGSNIPAKNYSIYYSTDGFSSSTLLTSGVITVASSGYPTTPQTITVPVGTTAFDAISGPMEFRLYLWGGTGFGQGTRFDDFNVQGTVAAASSPTAGGVIASYNFEGNSNAPTNVASNLTVSNIMPGNGLKNPGPGPQYATMGGVVHLDTPVIVATATSLAAAKTANDYYTLTLTPQAGFPLNIDRFTFEAFVGANGTPAKNYAVCSSLDGFATPLITGVINSTSNTTPDYISVPVSGTAFDALTSPIEFRLYVWGGQGTSTGTKWDNFEFTWGDQIIVGGGAMDKPAVGPAASYGLGEGAVLVKNWDFGTNGTIRNMTDLNSYFMYSDQFGKYNNGGGNYGAHTVAPTTGTSISGQPVEGTATGGQSVRQFFGDSLRTYLVPLNGATTVKASDYNVGCGSFVAKWELPKGGAHLGKDIIWETRVRYVTPKYFWFSIWIAGNKWSKGAEIDLIESFGYQNSGGQTNFDGDYWHSASVGGIDSISYKNGWGTTMSNVGITSFDASVYHIWTLVYRADNTFAAYVDGIEVQSGYIDWNFMGDPTLEEIDMTFLFDGAWGHTQINEVNFAMPASELTGKYYEWDYSRVYLREPTSVMETMELTYTPNTATWVQVDFSHPFIDPIVVMSPASNNGSDACHARIRNVTTTGFEYMLEEWDYLDGNHYSDETFYCLVIEKGMHNIGGLSIQAGAVTNVTNNWQIVNMVPAVFTSPPSILSQVVTTNEASAIVPRMKSINNGWFQVSVQEEQAANQTHAGETVHYVAIQQGTINKTGLKVKSGSANVTSTTSNVSFGATYNNPFFFASIGTTNDTDPAGLRHSGLSATSVSLKVEEEQSADSETAHSSESVKYLVIGE